MGGVQMSLVVFSTVMSHEIAFTFAPATSDLCWIRQSEVQEGDASDPVFARYTVVSRGAVNLDKPRANFETAGLERRPPHHGGLKTALSEKRNRGQFWIFQYCGQLGGLF